MGGYVNSSKCSICGGGATASADWRFGEKIELVECHNLNCGYVHRIESIANESDEWVVSNVTHRYQTQEEIKDLWDWRGESG